MDQLEIKKATITGLDELQRIGRQTFLEAFAADNNPENMKKYLDEKFSKEQLRKELSHPDSEFYMAVAENRVIGYLKVNRGTATTEQLKEDALEIERIYVLQEFHGQKAGQQLFEKALQIAREQKASCLWLGVWENNPKAIRFYEKNGLKEFDRHIFMLGDDEQTDILMKLELA